jgi:NAD(P)H dehydrogenase (quinone)
MNVSIIYHSETGNTESLAHHIVVGVKSLKEVDVQMMPVEAIDDEFLRESDVVFLGCPTYCGTYSWKLKAWFDTMSNKACLSGKLGAVFTTENHLGGGAENALLGLIGQMVCRGMLVYSGGHPGGQPLVHLGAVAIKNGDTYQQERAMKFGERITKKGLELFCRA